MKYKVTVRGIDGLLLWDNKCNNWEYDASMLRIHLHNDRNTVIRTICFPLHAVKEINVHWQGVE